MNLAYACVKPKPRLCVCQGPFVKMTNRAYACVKNRAYACVKNRAYACVKNRPKFALVILFPSLGSTRASRRAEYFLLCSSTRLSTPLRHLSAVSFLVSGWSPQMPTAIPVTQTMWFSCLSHKSICRQASMHVTLGAFAGASFWAQQSRPPWSSVPPGAALIVMFISEASLFLLLRSAGILASCSLLTQVGALMSRMSPAVVTDCFINPARGATVKVCPSVSLSPCLTRMFSRVLVLDWSSWATMLQLLPILI